MYTGEKEKQSECEASNQSQHKCKSCLFCITVWKKKYFYPLLCLISVPKTLDSCHSLFPLCWFNCVLFWVFFPLLGTFRCPILSPVGVSVCVHSWHVCICVHQAYSSRRTSPEYAALFLSSSSFCDSHKALIHSSLFSSHLLSNPSLQRAVGSNRLKPRSTVAVAFFYQLVMEQNLNWELNVFDLWNDLLSFCKMTSFMNEDVWPHLMVFYMFD